MTQERLITRFAPSPTGRLHIGNARTALFNWLLAKRNGGDLLLRIEDTDAERSRREFEQDLLLELGWLGLEWVCGPDRDGPTGPYRQSERQDIYLRYYAMLESADLAYPCFCSAESLKLARKTQLAAGKPPRYQGSCAGLTKEEAARRLANGEAATLRFRVPAGRIVEFNDLVRGAQKFASDDIGDFVIRRADGSPAFFFSNAVDDSLMGVTHALRGEDHLANTPRQLLLLEALGLRAPQYGHFPLVLDTDGGGLSKRLGSLGLSDLRAAGFLPLALANYLSRLGHSYSDEGFKSLDELAMDFEAQRFGRAPAKYDPVQLGHWQKEAVNRLDDGEMLDWLLSHEELSEIQARVPTEEHAHFVMTVRDNLVMPSDAARYAHSLYESRDYHEPAALEVLRATPAGFFRAAIENLEAAADFGEFAKMVGAASDSKGKNLYMPLRAAFTGMTQGPEMARVWDLLGDMRLRERLEQALQIAENRATR